MNQLSQRTIFLLLFISASCMAQSPTLDETQEWINYILENNGLEEESQVYGTTRHNRYSYYADFTDEGEMLLSYNHFINPPQSQQNFFYIIPLKFMKTISFTYEDDKVLVNISMQPKYVLVDDGKYIADENSLIEERKMIENGLGEAKYLSGFSLYFRKSFKEEDLPNRFKKAMNHLIELNGGKVVKEVF